MLCCERRCRTARSCRTREATIGRGGSLSSFFAWCSDSMPFVSENQLTTGICTCSPVPISCWSKKKRDCCKRILMEVMPTCWHCGRELQSTTEVPDHAHLVRNRLSCHANRPIVRDDAAKDGIQSICRIITGHRCDPRYRANLLCHRGRREFSDFRRTVHTPKSRREKRYWTRLGRV